MISSCSIKSKRRSCAAFSLSELAIVLGVVAIVVGGIWALVGDMEAKAQEESAALHIVQTVQGVRDFYKGLFSTGGTNQNLTSYLIEKNVLPSEVVRRRTLPYTAGHVWDPNAGGGSFIVWSSSVDTSGLFVIELNGLGYRACVNLTTKLTAAGRIRGLIGTQINGNALIAVPVTVDVASNQCDDNTPARILMTFRLRQQ